MIRRFCLALLLALVASVAFDASAAPRTPTSDSEVLDTLQVLPADPRMNDINRLRIALRKDPNNVAEAVDLAHRYYDLVAAEGDPRYVGYAQAALTPWWALPDPPLRVRVMRAVLMQFSHRFVPALADLEAAEKIAPDDPETLSWLAAIHMVEARYDQARHDCTAVAPYTSPLLTTACLAYVDSVTGKAPAAVAAIRGALRKAPQATPPELLWVLTRLAEIEERLGHYALAEAAYQQALAVHLTDSYLLAAYSDYLLDRGRPREVLPMIKDMYRNDVLLLRLAEAAKAMGDPSFAGYRDDMAARFDAAHLRGDLTHQKEEARFALNVQGEVARSLVLAKQNYVVQQEPIDARILLESAIAAHDKAAAEPALKWMADTHIESVALSGLAARVRALP